MLFVQCSKEEIKNTEVPENTSFVKTIGGSKNDVASSISNTNDGGYIILGHTQSNDYDFSEKENTSFDVMLLKYLANDELAWKKTYGGTDDDRGSKIITTADGNYAIIGYSRSNDIDVNENAGDKDFWLLKLDTSGNILWQKTFGYLGKDFGTSIIQTTDNGFLIVGELDVTSSGGQGNSKRKAKHAGGDIWAIKIDNQGNIQWRKYFGGSFTDTPYTVIQTHEGDYIIAGTSDSTDADISNNKGSYDFWVIKINSQGTLLWEKSLGGTEIDEAKSIVSIDNQYFFILGHTRSSDQNVSISKGGADLWLIKIDTHGNLLWEKSYGGNNFDIGNTIRKTNDGNFIIGGNTRSADFITNKGQNDAWLLKITPNGTVLWQKTIGGTDIDICYDVIETREGSIIGIGESTSNDQDINVNRGFSDLLIIKTQ